MLGLMGTAAPLVEEIIQRQTHGAVDLGREQDSRQRSLSAVGL
jgi:hypothetical protein